jgi:phage terminase small subunit
MAKNSERITPQQRAFIDAYVKNPDVMKAQEVAGYAPGSNGGYKALAKPAVHAEIVQRQLARLHNEVLPLAVQTHIDMLIDAKTPAGAKAQLVKLAYDRALGAQDVGANKAPHEMTADEIAKALLDLQREASNRATPIIEGESAQVAPNAFE